MIYIISATAVILAYLLGSLSGAIILSKKMNKGDIRSSGSGNAGATNMLRVYGKKAGILTLLFDVFKGITAVLVGIAADYFMRSLSANGFFESILLGNLKYITGVFVVIGHIFPIFFGFKGGKGVAASLGVILIINWQIGIIVAAAAIVIMAVSRYVSLGSIIGGILYPVSTLVFMSAKNEFNAVNFICSLILGILVIGKHHTNITRLLHGEERKLFEKKSD